MAIPRPLRAESRGNMNTALPQSSEQHASTGSREIFMHIWKLAVPSGALQCASTTEVELSASHTSDLYHLAPSCPACRRLRVQLEAIARSAVQRVSAITEVDFEVYSDPARIVCSPADGHRPSVTVSIHIWDRRAASTPTSASLPISQIQQALAAFGVRHR